jgi:hypothetical protein
MRPINTFMTRLCLQRPKCQESHPHLSSAEVNSRSLNCTLLAGTLLYLHFQRSRRDGNANFWGRTSINAIKYKTLKLCSVTDNFNNVKLLSLWSSDQSSCLQIQRSRFDSRSYHIFWEVMVQERGHSAPWVQLRNYLEEKVAAPV